MNWTEQQQAAIETTGKNILVSAAAGSGKTTVLVARIKNLVINRGVDIGRFLITTYTKAAAAEMKERLERAIREELKKPEADKAMLVRQLQQLPTANISTFHSFAIEIIRQYFYLTDLEPGFAVADDVQGAIIRKKAIDAVFEARYEENSEEFRKFILKYGAAGGDGQLKENIFDSYDTLTSIPDYIEHAEKKAEALDADSPMEAIGGFTLITEDIAEKLEEAIRKYEKAADMADGLSLPLVYGAVCENVEKLMEIKDRLPDSRETDQSVLRQQLVDFGGCVSAFKASTMSWKKDGADEDAKAAVEKYTKKAKELIKGIADTCGSDFDLYDEHLKAVSADTKYYIGLIREFDETFKAMKKDENIVDFNDLMHYAIAILKNEDAAAELREKFEYIFVDEYQDSNYLQEAIIGRIARDNNLFLVGDVKQSIYKFRLAEPELFMGKAEDYGDESDEKSVLININSNFRSKQNITGPVNDVFRKVMAGYDRAAELNCTAPAEYPGFPARLHIIQREEFDQDAPGAIEAEAALVAGIIRERLGREVYDGVRGEMRKLRLRDFAVLARKNRVVEEIERYLINDGIAAYGEGSGTYYETVEVQVFLNILRTIDNMRQDVPLISAMKSVVFAFTVTELVKIRTFSREGTYYSAVMEYAEKGDEEPLREKINDMIGKLAYWKEISRTVPLEDMMKTVLYDTGYYDYCSGLPVGTQRISNLRLIAEKAAGFEKISHGGLRGFLRYIESMQNAGKNDAEAKVIGENEDVVRVMTIHKSKGLEFPIVILADTKRGTEQKGHRHSIGIHRDYGVALPLIDRENKVKHKTFLQKAVETVKKKEVLDEEIRILYVALTRAKDGLEIIGTLQKSDDVSDDISTDSFLNMIYRPLTDRDEIELKEYDDPAALEQSHGRKVRNIGELCAGAEGVHDEAVADRLSYTYPHGSDASVKPKYSVSELNGRKEAGLTVADYNSLVSKDRKSLSAAKRGTIMHLLMEKADFARGAAEGAEYVQSVADMLLAEQTITPEEYDAISVKKAAGFFESPVGKRAADAQAAGKLHKEKEFILDKEIEGVPSVIQGIIDCWFEEDGQLVLVDYKSNYVSAGRGPEEIAKLYEEQISLYREALEGATGKTVKEAYLFLFDTGQFVEAGR